MFRNFFAPQAPSSHHSRSSSPSYSSHHRSNSSPQDLSYIYAPAGSTTDSPRSNSYTASQPIKPSSLRYAASTQTRSERPPIFRSASHRSGVSSMLFSLSRLSAKLDVYERFRIGSQVFVLQQLAVQFQLIPESLYSAYGSLDD
jgi:hypothetical protein